MSTSIKTISDACNFLTDPNQSGGMSNMPINRQALIGNKAALIAAGCQGYIFEQSVNLVQGITQEQIDNCYEKGDGVFVVKESALPYFLPTWFGYILSVCVGVFTVQSDWTIPNELVENAQGIDQYFEKKKSGQLTSLVKTALKTGTWAPVKQFLLSPNNPYVASKSA